MRSPQHACSSIYGEIVGPECKPFFDEDGVDVAARRVGIRGDRFDQIWFKGKAWADGHMIGTFRCFCDGASFYLSDHFGLLGFIDIHSDYRGTGAKAVSAARQRRLELGRMRLESVHAEMLWNRERERLGIQDRHVAKAHAERRARADVYHVSAEARAAR